MAQLDIGDQTYKIMTFNQVDADRLSQVSITLCTVRLMSLWNPWFRQIHSSWISFNEIIWSWSKFTPAAFRFRHDPNKPKTEKKTQETKQKNTKQKIKQRKKMVVIHKRFPGKNL